MDRARSARAASSTPARASEARRSLSSSRSAASVFCCDSVRTDASVMMSRSIQPARQGSRDRRTDCPACAGRIRWPHERNPAARGRRVGHRGAIARVRRARRARARRDGGRSSGIRCRTPATWRPGCLSSAAGRWPSPTVTRTGTTSGNGRAAASAGRRRRPSLVPRALRRRRAEALRAMRASEPGAWDAVELVPPNWCSTTNSSWSWGG